MQQSFVSATNIPFCRITGLVRKQDGTPVSGIKVQAFDIDLRSEQSLGVGETNTTGSYMIEYSTDSLTRPGKSTADLVIRAFDVDGTQIAESPLNFHVPPVIVINLTFNNLEYMGPSTFQSIQTSISPILQKVTADSLTSTDISYVSGETGITIPILTNYATAAKAAVSSGISSEAHFGLALAGLPADTEGLIGIPSETIQIVLQLSTSNNAIGPNNADLAESIATEFKQQSYSTTAASSTDLSIQSLSFTLPDEKLRASFLEAIDQYQGDPLQFWTELSKLPTFQDQALIQKLQFNIQLTALTSYNTSLVEEVLKQQTSGEVIDLKSLAGWSVPKWQAILTTTQPVNPSAVPVADTAIVTAVDSTPTVPSPEQTASTVQQTQLLQQAQDIADRLETAFPTIAIAANVGTSSIPQGADLAAFLNANQDFDIMADDAVVYTQTKNATPQVASSLTTLQRVYKIAPHLHHTTALIEAGMLSARDIARQPKQLFMTLMEGAIVDTVELEAIHARAQTVTGMVQNMFSKYTPSINSGEIRVMAHKTDLSKTGIPNWASLFRSSDYCSCRHCRSVLSPAAYMVDLLHEFVSTYIHDSAHQKGTAILFKRRPDINTMELSCRNTNTTLPYIDLVIELLENLVAPASATAHNSTDGDPASLAAMPEYINKPAYSPLQTDIFPWLLPFSLPNTLAALYLADRKVQRRQIMKALTSSLTIADPSQPAIQLADSHVCDALGINYLTWQIITAKSGQAINALWGVKSTEWASSWNTQAGPSVAAFLQQSGLIFAPPSTSNPTPDNPNPVPGPPFTPTTPTLIDLLETRFVQSLGSAQKPIQIYWSSNDEMDCNLSLAHIINVNNSILGSLLQFLRLQLVMKCSIQALDQMLTTLGPAGITPQFLRESIATLDLQLKVKLPLPDLLTWWGNMPTMADSSGGTSLYARLFQNPAVSNPLNPAFRLNPESTDLQNTSDSIEDHLDMLQSALLISGSDLTLLVYGLNLPVLPSGKHTLNLSVISQLFRCCSLANILNLSIKDLLGASQLVPFDLTLTASSTSAVAPFDPTHMSDIESLITSVTNLKFQIPELEYLLQDHGVSFSPLAPQISDIVKQLSFIQLNIVSAPDQTLLSLSKWLKLDTSVITLLVDQQPAGFPDTGMKILSYPGFVAATTSLSSATVNAAIANLNQPVNASSDDTLYHQTRLLLLLWKCSILINRMKLNHNEIKWLFSQTAGYINPLTLPVAGRVPVAPLYTPLLMLTQICAIRDSLAPGQPFTILFPTATDILPDYLNALANQTGWNYEDLTFLSGAKGLNLTFSSDYLLPQTFSRLTEVFNLLNKIKPGGGIAAQVADWVGIDLTESQAETLTAVVKANYSPTDWSTHGSAIRNPLREKQRDALVAYLLNHSQQVFNQTFISTDDLYEYLLIDVEMQSCMLTSRIVQATMSIQLFISRCMMNLEHGVTVTAGAAEAWLWMSQYRVWEANRQIFLYPENWMDPTLRDDKSPFFLDMEKYLKKNVATTDVMEQVYLRYLSSLDSVARLYVCGMYHDYHPDISVDVLYVFARTIGASPTYYYRTFVDGYSWTAWEKVDLDIGGVDVIPVIYNRRLYLYWPIFSVIADQPSGQTIPHEGDSNVGIAQPNRRVQISLAWSEYTADQWSAKSVTKTTPIQVTAVIAQPSENQVVLNSDHSVDPGWFAFKAFPYSSRTPEMLIIECFVRSNPITWE